MTKRIGIYVGRFCPIHKGHEAVVNKMIEECGVENSLIIIGSVARKPTFRVLFPYSQRKKWIKEIFPNVFRF